MSSPAAIPVTTPGLPEKAAAALVNSFRLASVTQRLRYHVQAGERSDVKEFQIRCISLAKGIDFAIANNEIPKKVEEFPLLLKQVCKHRTDVYTTTAVTVLMISVKHACQLGWFSDIESQELTAIADEMRNSFGSFGKTSPDIKSPEGTFSQIMERFYTFVKIGHVLVCLEVKAGYKMLAHDFHISKKMPHSPQEKIRLFVVQTDNIDTSACISNPPEVSLLLNGKGLEKRVNITMDSGPQLPSNVTALLKYGTNLLQVMGNSKGHYIIVIAFTSLVLPPENPVLKDYLQSGFIESSPDSDIIEGPSRVSLNCPISRSRIKLPVKGQLCKHLQCFDFWNYYHINMRNPSWRCPHCNQSVCYPEICLDQNMVKILKESGNNAADVIIHADGTWKVAKEIEQTEEPVQDVIIHDLEDSGPVVLDLTGDDDDAEMEIFGDGKVVDRKPCLLDAQGQSNSNDTSKDASDVISLDQVILNHLNAGTGQEHSNLPQIPLPQDPTPSPRDRPATTSTIPNPAPQVSQVHASPATPAGTYQRWNPTYSSQAPLVTTSSQSRRHPVPVTSQSPPIPRVLNSQPNSYFIPSPNSNHVRQNPSGPTVQSVSRTSDLTSNHGSTQRQHTSTGPTVQSVSRASDLITNHGSTQRQHPIAPTVQSVTRTSDLMDVDSTTPDLTNWRPRMRGSITPGSYSPALDRMIIRPTQQSQTTPHGSQPVQTPPVQTSQAQPPFPTAAFRPETVLVSQNLPVPTPPSVTRPSGAGGSTRGGRSSSQSGIPDTPFLDTPIPFPPRTTASAPTIMSIEDFVSQPGRDRLTRLDPELPPNTTWFQFSGNGISRSINTMLNCLISCPYPTYNSMPVTDRDSWFRQFAQDFTWDRQLTGLVRRKFDEKAARMYSWKMNEYKDMWMRLGKVPRGMKNDPALWAALIAYWEREETKAASATHSTNRKSNRKGKGPATHNLGATSKATRAEQLFEKEGVRPSNMQLIKDAHTNRKTGELQDGLARHIVESVERLGEEYIQSQPIIEVTPLITEVPFEKINEFTYEVTPKDKGRVFGLPEDSSTSSVSSYRFHGDNSLRAHNAELLERMNAMEAQRAEDAVRLAESEERVRVMEEKMNAFG